MKITLKILARALVESWGKDTASGGIYKYCPSHNQCAVTAMVVQDYFCGDLMRQALDDGDSHYWNRLPDGQEIDLTFEQFFYSKQKGVGKIIVREREYVNNNPDTYSRYFILKKRVQEYLEAEE